MGVGVQPPPATELPGYGFLALTLQRRIHPAASPSEIIPPLKHCAGQTRQSSCPAAFL